VYKSCVDPWCSLHLHLLPSPCSTLHIC
jgi:hypothetical protein